MIGALATKTLSKVLKKGSIKKAFTRSLGGPKSGCDIARIGNLKNSRGKRTIYSPAMLWGPSKNPAHSRELDLHEKAMTSRHVRTQSLSASNMEKTVFDDLFGIVSSDELWNEIKTLGI